MGDEFIPLINKGGGAGVQVTAYQTLSDIEARIGDRAKAGGGRQFQQPDHDAGTGNRHCRTADQTTAAGGCAQQQRQFRRHRQHRRSGQYRISSNTGSGEQRTVPLLEPAHWSSSPKAGICPAGRRPTLEITYPLPDATHDPLMPENIAQIARYMEKQYDSAPVWWNRPRQL
ncbi:hypothetical protein JS565_16995 [Salmonella enterica subsp. enterica serovar Senftenberg]|nr:hypothetical protein [Salmonella enterica subsp. enterica serovar Senftenberg]